MNSIHKFRLVRCAVVMGGLSLGLIGCGGNKSNEIAPEAANTQRSASEAWAKVKADGSDKARSRQAALGAQGNNRGHHN